jgi:hypothetical protein
VEVIELFLLLRLWLLPETLEPVERVDEGRVGLHEPS